MFAEEGAEKLTVLKWNNMIKTKKLNFIHVVTLNILHSCKEKNQLNRHCVATSET